MFLVKEKVETSFALEDAYSCQMKFSQILSRVSSRFSNLESVLRITLGLSEDQFASNCFMIVLMQELENLKPNNLEQILGNTVKMCFKFIYLYSTICKFNRHLLSTYSVFPLLYKDQKNHIKARIIAEEGCFSCGSW